MFRWSTVRIRVFSILSRSVCVWHRDFCRCVSSPFSQQPWCPRRRVRICSPVPFIHSSIHRGDYPSRRLSIEETIHRGDYPSIHRGGYPSGHRSLEASLGARTFSTAPRAPGPSFQNPKICNDSSFQGITPRTQTFIVGTSSNKGSDGVETGRLAGCEIITNSNSQRGGVQFNRNSA